MKRFKNALTASVIQSYFGGELIGDTSIALNCVAEPSAADQNAIVFLEQEKLVGQVLVTNPGLIITTKGFAEVLQGKNLLLVDKPYYIVLMLLSYWIEQDNATRAFDIDPSARVGLDCDISEPISLGANVIIGNNCKIGRNTRIESNCVISDNCVIGENCHLYANVVLYEDSILGDRVILHSGVVIGADGFGYILMGGKQQKIPQIGNVVIQNDVEIGANSSIDRATLGSTIVGEGTKIDNIVQVGHNCSIGKHSILCSQVGLAGSTIIGDYVYLAGQVGVAGHLTIGDRAMVGAQSGVVSDIEPDSKYFGSPAREAGLTKRIMAVEKHLPEMYKTYTKSLKQNVEPK